MREDIELELQALRNQMLTMQSIHSSEKLCILSIDNMCGILVVKTLEEALQRKSENLDALPVFLYKPENFQDVLRYAIFLCEFEEKEIDSIEKKLGDSFLDEDISLVAEKMSIVDFYCVMHVLKGSSLDGGVYFQCAENIVSVCGLVRELQEGPNKESKGMKMNGLHAVMVPYPAQGSINPLINLAQLLSSQGVFITFVNTEWSHQCMSKAAHNDDELSTSTFKFLNIPDGLPPDHGRLANLAEYVIAIQKLGPVLEHHLRCGLAEGTPPITCIIAENSMSCTHEVAYKLGVPRVIFWTVCAASSIAHCNSNLLLSRGHIPVKVEELKREDKVITCLPGNLPPLLPSDLCSFYRTTDTSNVYFQWFLRESQFQSKADYVLVNTFDELEAPQTVSALSCNGCPALAVGPVFLPNFLEGKDLCKQASLLEQDESCLKWLDTQQPDSVIYVSFGSLAVSSNEQLEELAVGLEKSEHPFLWVLRMDIARGTPATLPEGFEERTKDRGW
ncbi:hypothetical protein SUGI_0089150 [Cryptomeria japonica]|nr:hypothetical protein SUGI_0089150 [Cryptomeria japonica]